MAHYIYGTCPTLSYTWYNSVSIQFVPTVSICIWRPIYGGCNQKYGPWKNGLISRHVQSTATDDWTVLWTIWTIALSLLYWHGDCRLFKIWWLDNLIKTFIKVSPLPLPPRKKLVQQGAYMGNWTNVYVNQSLNTATRKAEAKNTLDARCISIQCWYDRSNIFWKKLVSHFFCVYNAIWCRIINQGIVRCSFISRNYRQTSPNNVTLFGRV